MNTGINPILNDPPTRHILTLFGTIPIDMGG